MKIKTKDNFNAGGNKKTSNKKKLKGDGKSTPKFSPEVNLGLKLEKLIEKGVKVKKIDSVTPEKKNITPKLKKSTLTPNTMTSPKVSSGGAGKNPNSTNYSSDNNLVKNRSPLSKSEKTQSSIVNGKSRNKGKKRSLETDDQNLHSPNKQKKIKSQAPLNRLELSKVVKAVEACLEKNRAKGNNKLIDVPDQLYLQLTVIKKAITPKRMCRFNLKHSLVGEDSDICLFVRDEKGQETDKTVEYYKELLQKNGFNNIKKILTYSQLRAEYSRHELRRKLCNAHDYFIGDARLSKSLLKHLGKHFITTRKVPIYLHLDGKNFKENVTKALHRTAMKITPHQDMFSCIIGNVGFPAQHIGENISVVADSIDPSIFPGGWDNIRSMSIKTDRGSRFPIYYNAISPDSIATPIVKPKRPKAAVPVVGELSTSNDAVVKVEPDGTVTFIKKKRANKKKKIQGDNLNDKKQGISNEDEDDEDDNDDNENEDESEDDDTSDFDISDDDDDEPVDMYSKKSRGPLVIKSNKKEQNNVADEESEGEDDSDDEEEDEDEEDDNDDVGAKAEQEYLKQMQDQLSADGDDDEDEDDDDGDDDDDDSDIEIDDSDEEDKVQNKKQLKQQNNNNVTKTGKNFVKNPQNDDDDDEDSDEEEDDDDDDDEWGSDSDDKVSFSSNSKKRKPVAQNNNSSPFKKSKPDNVVKHQNKTSIGNKKQGMFDTTLGETWAIKKKQSGQISANQHDSNKKKNNKKSHKVNKHQRKANIKMNKAKKNKR